MLFRSLATLANDFVVDFVGRSDIGIKLLSLQQASDRARHEPAHAGPALSSRATLREALSFMSAHHLEQVNLVDGQGRGAGVLHAVDIFREQEVNTRRANKHEPPPAGDRRDSHAEKRDHPGGT